MCQAPRPGRAEVRGYRGVGAGVGEVGMFDDLTLSDIGARNLIYGGVHYRVVFYTNLRGLLWLLGLA